MRIDHCMAKTHENQSCSLNQENSLKIEEDILLCKLQESYQKVDDMSSRNLEDFHDLDKRNFFEET